MLAQSTCTQAAIGNWVGSNTRCGWAFSTSTTGGCSTTSMSTNVTRKLEPSYRPCASITAAGKAIRHSEQRDGQCAAERPGALHRRQQGCDDPDRSSQGSRAPVHGVRVLPGGGWNHRQVSEHIPFLVTSGSLYLFSNSAQPVQLLLHLVPNVQQSTVGLFEANGQSVSTTIGHDSIEADLDLRRGVTRIDLGTAAERRSAPPVADLERRNPHIGRVLNSLPSGHARSSSRSMGRAAQAVAPTTMTQLSNWSGPPPPAQNRTSLKPAPSSHRLHSGGVGSRMKCVVCRVSPSR